MSAEVTRAVFQKGKADIRKGLIYDAAACLLLSTVPPVGRHLSRIGPVFLTCARSLIAGVLLEIVTAPRHFSQIANAVSNDLIRIAFLGLTGIFGIVPNALGFFLWYHALETVEAGRLAPLQLIAPVGSALIGKAALGEEMTALPLWGPPKDRLPL